MTDWMHPLTMVLERPEVLRWLSLTAAGIVGAVVSIALDAKAFVLPAIRGRRVELGSTGPLLACVAAAHFVDHDFQTALLGSLCGVSALRHIRARIQSAFDHEIERLGEGGGSDGPGD